MTWDEVMDAFNKAVETPAECSIRFWIGPDGVFHDNWDNYPEEDEFICTCSVTYDESDNTWIVTPWFYFTDYPGVYKTLESTRQMFFFWLNWMEKLYGSDAEDPRFEKDWLAVKSNRSVLEILFDQEGERLKEKLYKNEEWGIRNEQ